MARAEQTGAEMQGEPTGMCVADAVLSDCGTYRYRLTRSWGAGRQALFILLNPSTADARVDDPTLRRCMGFARREGCDGLEVVNLMAWRATRPADLPSDPIRACGPDNAGHIRAAVMATDGPIIAGWGAHPLAAPLGTALLAEIAAMGRTVHALKLTRAGAPGHPLYIRRDADVR